MPQVLKLKIAGLYTHPNTLSEIPEGALAIADNIVLDRESIAETRRGFKQYGEPFSSNTEAPVHKLINFKQVLLLHHNTKLAYDANADGSSWIDANTVIEVPATNLRVQSTQANNNLYLTTNAGVQKIATAGDEPRRAGVPRANDILAVNAGPGVAVPVNTQVAYRVLFGYRDGNNNLILGAPSPRAVLVGSNASDISVNINFSVPREIQGNTEYFYQIYRSQPSVDENTPPDDELQLVSEVSISAGTNLTFTDNIPFELLGAALYTNSLQEGILQANERPPYSTDIVTYNNHTFFFNTKQPHRIVASILALPANGDNVVIDSISYVADSSENVAARKFEVFSSGDLENDIPDTLVSLSRVVNRDSNAAVSVTYLGGTSFLIERDDFGAAYNASCSNSSVFNASYTSDDEAKQNRIYISKSQRPEAVPGTNNLDCGRSDRAIYRGLGLRDMIGILKPDGIYRITGNDLSNFTLEPLDTTYQIVGPECATTLSNHIFCTSTQGVLAISTAGVVVMSRPIEKDILSIIQLSAFSTYAWAVGYDSDRKYILGVPAADSSSNVEFLYVYNTMTSSWTTYQVAWSHAVVGERDNKLYSLRISDNQVLQERKDLTISDYADDEFAVNIVASNAASVTVDDANSLSIGMTLVQDNQRAIITDISTNILTTDAEDATWVNNAAVAYTPIRSKIRWTEEHCGNPGLVKILSEITFMFESARFHEITFRASTNFLSGFKETVLRALSASRWGRFPWGRIGWGTGLGGFQPIRTYFPRETNRALWTNIELELEEAFTTFGLAGATLVVEATSSRFK